MPCAWVARLGLPHLLGCLAALMISAATSFTPTPARAQYTPQTGSTGWCTVIGGGGATACFASPAAACAKQHEVYGGPGALYAPVATEQWFIKECKWEWVFGYSQPATVSIECDYGYSKKLGGFCEATGFDFQLQTKTCANSEQITKNPISLLTGAKQFHADDFTSADGGLCLARTFTSKSFGGVGALMVSGNPKGLGNWLFDFQYELQIPPSFASYQTVTLLAPRGGGFQFQKQAGAALLSVGQQSNQQVFYKLEIVGSWPSDPRTAKTYWKMTDSDDGVWLMESFADPVTGKFTAARPTSHTTREGLVRTFSYSTAGILNQVQDSYGKVITFIWSSSTLDDRAITQANLPGGYKMVYEYGAASGGLPERLLSATLQNASNVILDKTFYDYGNATFPNFVTGIRDRDTVLRWAATYDWPAPIG